MSAKFRVLSGRHRETHFVTNESGERKRNHQGEFVEKHVVYGPGCAAGDVVESEMNLLAHNPPGCPPKFQMIDEGPPDTEDALLRRIQEDQRRLSEIRSRRGTTAEASPAAIAAGQSQISAPASTMPTVPAAKPTPHVTPKAESDAVRQKQLMAMSPAQLKQLAEDDEIDVTTCKSKEDFVRAILGTAPVAAK